MTAGTTKARCHGYSALVAFRRILLCLTAAGRGCSSPTFLVSAHVSLVLANIRKTKRPGPITRKPQFGVTRTKRHLNAHAPKHGPRFRVTDTARNDPKCRSPRVSSSPTTIYPASPDASRATASRTGADFWTRASLADALGSGSHSVPPARGARRLTCSRVPRVV